MIFHFLTTTMVGVKLWGAFGRKGHQYVILCDDGKYTASKKFTIKNKTKYLIPYEKPVASFEEAKAVCEASDNPS